jgi:DNA-binding NarL/FixJ family response regulator
MRILIADRQNMFRGALKEILQTEPDFTVVADTEDGEALPRLVSKHKPDVLLFELKLHKRPGIDALREITIVNPEVRPILLTDRIDRSKTVQAIICGARGVIRKNEMTALLFKSIRTVMAGQYWIGHESVAGLVENLRLLHAAVEQSAQKQAFKLTRQQHQIIQAIVAGYPNKEIAQKLSLSERTVKYHLGRLFGKFGVSSRMELARFSLQNKVAPEA